MTYKVPFNWFWIVGGDTSQAWSSAAGAYVATWPGDAVTRIESADALSSVLRPFGLIVPKPIASDLQAEYQRRLVALLGARDIGHAGFIHADDHRELQELKAVAEPTFDQAARIAELETRAAAVSALIEKYNEIPDNPVPVDYRNDEHWS